MLYKKIVITFVINASYLELYLKMSSFSDISQKTSNVERLFQKHEHEEILSR